MSGGTLYLVAIGVEPPCLEGVGLQFVAIVVGKALDPDDDIRVDIGFHQRCSGAFDFSQRFHGQESISLRTSVMQPVTAAAAAIAGEARCVRACGP